MDCGPYHAGTGPLTPGITLSYTSPTNFATLYFDLWLHGSSPPQPPSPSRLPHPKTAATLSIFAQSPLCREIKNYRKLATSFKEQMSNWTLVSSGSPAFEFVLPLITAMTELKKPPLPSSGLLRKPLHNVSMQCALPGCSSQREVSS